MAAAILTIEYGLSDLRKTLTSDQSRERARQISLLAGLRWKYWLEEHGTDKRGGVYLFGTAAETNRAKDVLTGSLSQAGAANPTGKVYRVDEGLSAITRAGA